MIFKGGINMDELYETKCLACVCRDSVECTGCIRNAEKRIADRNSSYFNSSKGNQYFNEIIETWREPVTDIPITYTVN